MTLTARQIGGRKASLTIRMKGLELEINRLRQFKEDDTLKWAIAQLTASKDRMGHEYAKLEGELQAMQEGNARKENHVY